MIQSVPRSTPTLPSENLSSLSCNFISSRRHHCECWRMARIALQWSVEARSSGLSAGHFSQRVVDFALQLLDFGHGFSIRSEAVLKTPRAAWGSFQPGQSRLAATRVATIVMTVLHRGASRAGHSRCRLLGRSLTGGEKGGSKWWAGRSVPASAISSKKEGFTPPIWGLCSHPTKQCPHKVGREANGQPPLATATTGAARACTP